MTYETWGEVKWFNELVYLWYGRAHAAIGKKKCDELHYYWQQVANRSIERSLADLIGGKYLCSVGLSYQKGKISMRIQSVIEINAQPYANVLCSPHFGENDNTSDLACRVMQDLGIAHNGDAHIAFGTLIMLNSTFTDK